MAWRHLLILVLCTNAQSTLLETCPNTSGAVDGAIMLQRQRRSHDDSQGEVTAANDTTPWPIDMVLCWAGPQCALRGTYEVSDHDVGCNNGELATLLRLAANHTPWLRKVFVLVNPPLAEKKASLAESAKGLDLVMVDRCQLFKNPSDCPTNNSHACTSVQHLVPNLSEHYIVSDDDFFTVKPLTYLDFFTADGRPLIFRTEQLLKGAAMYTVTNGPNMPPAKRPERMNAYIHLPMPMRKSFAERMESSFAEWFSFVRSHTHRFICCNASVSSSSNDEDFTRVYPLYLHRWDVGAVHPEHDAYCEHGLGLMACVATKMKTQKFVNANNVETPESFRALQELLEKSLTASSVALLSFAHTLDDSLRIKPAIFIQRSEVSQDLTCAAITAILLLTPLTLALVGVPIQIPIFILFVGSHTAFTMVSYAAKGEASSTAMVVMSAFVMKFMVSVGLWRALEGGSLYELPGAAWTQRATLVQYIIPAGLYTFSDMLRIRVIQHTDTGTYAVLFNLRTILLAFVWQRIFNRRILPAQWLALVLIMLGCILKEFPHLHGIHDDGDSANASVVYQRWWSYGEVVLMGILTIVAAVWNEWLLKNNDAAGVSLQNLAMYAFGMVFSLISQGEHLFDGAVWSKAVDPHVLAQITLLALFGIVTSYFLKYLSTVIREVALGIFMVLSVAIDVCVFGKALNAFVVGGVCVVLVGAIAFAYAVPTPTPTK